MLMNLTKKKIVSIVVIIGIIVVATFFFLRQNSNVKFNSQKWKNWTESESEISLRWDMVTDLQKQYILKGQTRFQIINLLGEPENKNQNRFYYYLGASKHGINIGTLIIIFNNKGIVIDFLVVEG